MKTGACSGGLKPNQCAKCGAVFMEETELDEYITTCVGRRVHQCGECTQTFTEQSVLLEHIRIHSHRTKECRFCGKVFKNMGHLRDHEITHTGYRPYQCHVCGKSFSRDRNLKQHHRIHTGEDKFFFFFFNFWKTQVFFVGPLIPLFWTSGDVSPGFQSQGGSPHLHAFLPACNEFLRFTSGATPVDCIEVRTTLKITRVRV